MILQALVRYYEAMVESGDLSKPGWSSAVKVAYALEIDDNGNLVHVIPLGDELSDSKTKKHVPLSMDVPFQEKRTSGVIARFLCDTSAYFLGVDKKYEPEEAKKRFIASRKLHHEILDDVDSPAAKAILAFFDNWNPDEATENPVIKPNLKELTSGQKLLFFFNGISVIEDSEISDAWQRYYDSFSGEDADPSDMGVCLVTGKQAQISLVHPDILGVRNAKVPPALVSFNKHAFESYGKEKDRKDTKGQGKNAPVSKYAASAYTAVLNSLLADSDRCRYIGNTIVLCWSESGRREYQKCNNSLVYGDAGIDPQDLTAALKSLASGKPFDWNGFELSPDEHFYYLGLVLRSGRLSVSFFLEDSFGSFARNIDRHYERLRIIGPKGRIPTPYWLVSETVRQGDEVPTRFTDDLIQSILTDSKYPATLLNAINARIRAEKDVSFGKAAFLKAYYLQNENSKCPKEVLTVELNEQSEYLPYVLGRLFSVLAELQEKSAGTELNVTIRNRYFTSASTTPAITFDRLLRLSQHHLSKLSKGSQISYDRKITNLVSKIHSTIPTRFTPVEQVAFQIGYYHENQSRYTTKEDK